GGPPRASGQAAGASPGGVAVRRGDRAGQAGDGLARLRHEPAASEPGGRGVGLSRAKPVGGQLVAAERAAAGADTDVSAVREPNRWAGAVAEPGVAPVDRTGVDSEEEAARKGRDAERVVCGSGRQAEQEAECGAAAQSVQGDQLGGGRGGGPAGGAGDGVDSPATPPAGTLGVAA